MQDNCWLCNKKLNPLYSIQCRCHNYYCKKHRLPEDHNCQFDYTNKDELSKNLKGCIGTKIDKIWFYYIFKIEDYKYYNYNIVQVYH